MKRYCFLLSVMLGFLRLGYAQDLSHSIKLDPIMDIPVKIDGGGSFYTYDTAKVVPGNEILVISNLRVAIIKVASKSDFIYLHPQNLNRKRPTGGIDTSTFIGNGYMIKLNTRKVKSINNHEDLYSGTLTIKYKQRSFVIKIHGIEDFLH